MITLGGPSTPLSPGSRPESHIRIAPGISGSSTRGPEQGLREGPEPESMWDSWPLSGDQCRPVRAVQCPGLPATICLLLRKAVVHLGDPWRPMALLQVSAASPSRAISRGHTRLCRGARTGPLWQMQEQRYDDRTGDGLRRLWGWKSWA